MNKVFAHTYWIMWGEHDGTVKRIERCWFLQAAPPHYHGDGIGIRFGKKVLRFGVCYNRAPITTRELDAAVIDYTVAWRDHTEDGKEIGKWGSDAAAPTAAQ